ncbi:inositol monophosphatase [Candidatus Kaiserbacteria bacterium]|nr:inositol monophosphatase [Candidatus Kaiserbacteria bacterium]
MEKFIQDITKKAGTAVLKQFRNVGVKYMKSDDLWDCVTQADLDADRIIVSAIKKKYPSHGIISEESGEYYPDSEYVWIIDPIDGTRNFATHVPLFGTMVALAHKGDVMLAAIDMPATNEFFFARAGKGAFLNGKRIHCTKTDTLSRSAGYGGSSLRHRTRKFLRNLVKSRTTKQTIIGSFACCANQCYVAAGRADWVVSLSGKIWDFAPVSLILKEAGCTVTDVSGRPWTLNALEIVAANPVLHKQLLKLTKGI